MSFSQIVDDQRNWSSGTFGPGSRIEGICKHIEKELAEIRLEVVEGGNYALELIDVFILTIDALWRSGLSSEEIIDLVLKKQAINRARLWERDKGGDFPIEHVRQ